ncbi:unnamed protein product [Gongylonema pulchrum]|uniref:Ryanodine receptor Ryr domain-containing protein n=1 Tax=Gongylonema pulchrum TaxID=637853 RepID=A0A3P6R2Z8_9BILA|nr:unnamed protein product [Gongylonema pulchrum]
MPKNRLLRKQVHARLARNSRKLLITNLQILTLHYERCTKYYGSGNTYGMASETEKRLSMLLFYAIFDSLGSKPYDPELFGKALPCLTAIGSAISPDYTLTTASEDLTDSAKTVSDQGVWIPKPTEVSKVRLGSDLESIIAKFAEHFHDSWASRKVNFLLFNYRKQLNMFAENC